VDSSNPPEHAYGFYNWEVIEREKDLDWLEVSLMYNTDEQEAHDDACLAEHMSNEEAELTYLSSLAPDVIMHQDAPGPPDRVSHPATDPAQMALDSPDLLISAAQGPYEATRSRRPIATIPFATGEDAARGRQIHDMLEEMEREQTDFYAYRSPEWEAWRQTRANDDLVRHLLAMADAGYRIPIL